MSWFCNRWKKDLGILSVTDSVLYLEGLEMTKHLLHLFTTACVIGTYMFTLPTFTHNPASIEI
jgi:hypothetical protein